MRFFVLIALATTALAVALPEPQKCNPSINCCTYTETACNNRGDACTATCNVRPSQEDKSPVLRNL